MRNYAKSSVCLGDTTVFSLRLLVRALALTHPGPGFSAAEGSQLHPSPAIALCGRGLPHPRVPLHPGASPGPVTWIQKPSSFDSIWDPSEGPPPAPEPPLGIRGKPHCLPTFPSAQF